MSTVVPKTRSLVTAALVAMAGLSLAACSSSSSGAGPSATTTGPAPRYTVVSPATTKAADSDGSAADPAPDATSAGSAAGGRALRYKKIVEPFSPPGTCKENGSTLEMTACVLEQVIDADSTINTLQDTQFELARPSKQAGLLAE